MTRWCVTNITSEPELFTNEASALVEANKPVWGTCPSDCIITYSQNITSFTTTETTQGFSPSTILFTLNEICTQNDPHLEYVAGLPSGLSVELNYFPATATTPSNWSGVITGTAETGTQGSYNIELAVSNAVPADGVNIGDPGTTSSTISFNLIVNELQSNTDTIPPVITLNGSSTVQLNVGDTWTDPGASANDETDGDISDSITVNGTVDTSTVGTYTLTYSVTDAANNTNSTTRTVIVNPITHTLWQGDSLTFTKTAESDPNTEDNQDRITASVWITRGNNGGQIYNIVTENSAVSGTSPVGTEWAQGTFNDIGSLTFSSFRNACPGQKPKNIVGIPMVLHIIQEDIYLSKSNEHDP